MCSNEECASVEIDRNNCFNLYFNEHNEISYTRNIDNKLYNITIDASEEGLIHVLSNLSDMCDDTFILTCELHKSIR